MKDPVEEVLDRARESISSYCIEECHAYCCRKGYLVMSPETMKVTMQGREEEYIADGSLKCMSDGKWSLYFNRLGCPSLKDSKCMIHKDPLRCDTCRIFPIHVQDGVIKISRRCPAGREKKFYPFVCELIELGCQIKK